MIYLITGSPGCGKTTLAKNLSNQLSIPWISANTLESIIFVHTQKNLQKKYSQNNL